MITAWEKFRRFVVTFLACYGCSLAASPATFYWRCRLFSHVFPDWLDNCILIMKFLGGLSNCSHSRRPIYYFKKLHMGSHHDTDLFAKNGNNSSSPSYTVLISCHANKGWLLTRASGLVSYLLHNQEYAPWHESAT